LFDAGEIIARPRREAAPVNVTATATSPDLDRQVVDAIGITEQVGGIAIDGLDREDPRRGPCRLRAHLDTGDHR
jgi:hypothetical protein